MKHILIMCLGLVWAGTVFTENAVTTPYSEFRESNEKHLESLWENENRPDPSLDNVIQSDVTPFRLSGEPTGGVIDKESERLYSLVNGGTHDGLSIRLDGIVLNPPAETQTVLDESVFIQGLAVLILAVGSVIILAVFMKVTAVSGDLVSKADKKTASPSPTHLSSDGTC